MTKKDKKNKEEKSYDEMNFFEKYKNDKKYKAKVQLIGYGIFILVLIIGLNISSLNSPINGNNISLKDELINQDTLKNDNDKDKEELWEKIDKNYEYDVKVTTTIGKEETETKEVKYYGKNYNEYLEITKEVDNLKTNYYKVGSNYYIKKEEKYDSIKEDVIYNSLEKNYIELEAIKELIKKASLDHITNYSSGKKEYVYHLKVKDIIQNYQELDEIEIKINEENNILTITADYTKLMIELYKGENIKEVNAIYTYKNIGTVEEFKIDIESSKNIEDNKENNTVSSTE